MMGFLPSNAPPEKHEVKLCDDLWALTKGDTYNGVSFDTLKIVMLNMIGIKT